MPSNVCGNGKKDILEALLSSEKEDGGWEEKNKFKDD